MKPTENLLLVADSEHDANMLYAARLFVPDPFIWLRIRGRDHLVMSDLEIDRARVQAPHCHVHSLSKLQQQLRTAGVKRPSLADVTTLLLQETHARKVFVPENFPLGLANDKATLIIIFQEHYSCIWQATFGSSCKCHCIYF